MQDTYKIKTNPIRHHKPQANDSLSKYTKLCAVNDMLRSFDILKIN
jgi:hypothetical protein